MPKYMFKANYSPEGARGLLKEGGSTRVAAIEAVAKSVGGKIEGFYFAFGDTDAYVIGEMPNNAAAAAVSLTVGASGAASVETVVLLTPAEADEAAKKTVTYRAPGAK